MHLETAELFRMYTWAQQNFFVHRLPSYTENCGWGTYHNKFYWNML